MEAEINSPIVALKPTETYVWDTAWSPIRIGSAPQVMNDAGVVEQRLRAVRNGDSISVRGTFSVFNPGELTALLLDSRGLEVNRRDLGTVRPEAGLAFAEELPGRREDRPGGVEAVGLAWCGLWCAGSSSGGELGRRFQPMNKYRTIARGVLLLVCGGPASAPGLRLARRHRWASSMWMSASS